MDRSLRRSPIPISNDGVKCIIGILIDPILSKLIILYLTRMQVTVSVGHPILLANGNFWPTKSNFKMKILEKIEFISLFKLPPNINFLFINLRSRRS